MANADPPLLILTSLASGPKHGYALAKDIERFAGARLGPGTLYGAIGRLEQRGLIEACGPAEERRQPYQLTGAGRVELEACLAGLQRILDEGRAQVAARRPLRRRAAPGAGLSGALPVLALAVPALAAPGGRR